MAKRSAWRRLSDYIRHDFSEIVWPRSMPDPPGTRYITELSLKRHAQVWRDAIREYTSGWRWYHGEPEEDKAKRRAEERAARAAAGDESGSSGGGGGGDGPDGYTPDPDDNTTFKDEFGRMIRVGQQVGFQGWKQQIQHFYQTRGRAYRDAMKEFVAGYKEGVREAATPPSSQEGIQLDFDPTDFSNHHHHQHTPPPSGGGVGGVGGGGDDGGGVGGGDGDGAGQESRK